MDRNFFGELIWAIKARRRYDFWMEAWHYKMEEQRWCSPQFDT